MHTEPTKAEPPKRKRRRFQFRLRTLMIVVIAVVFPLVFWPMWIEVGQVRGTPVYEPNLLLPPLAYAGEIIIWGAWHRSHRT
jgi:hypothetical protein